MPAAPGTPPIAVPPGPRESREYLSATPSGPRIKCGVTCRDSPTPGHSAPDAESRECPGEEYHRRHLSGPRIKCGVTRRDSPTPGHSALRRGIQESCVSYSFILLGQREERTKKRRRCYRAETVADCTVVGGCGTRLRLRQSSPRSLLPASPLPAR